MSGGPNLQVLRELRLRDFRNFHELDIQVPEDGVVIIGENGSGKTNLLEAVYYLETFRSMRGARDEQLVRFGADGFHVRGRFESPTTAARTEVAVGYDARSKRKRVTVDGVEVDRLGDAIGAACVTVFSPDDVALVSGGPAERRRFLDIVLCLNRPGHLDALQRYRQALRQRNAMLKDGADPAVLEAYDAGLIDAASTVMHDRARWTARHAGRFAGLYERIVGRPAAMRYRPSPRVSGDESGTGTAAGGQAQGGDASIVAPPDRAAFAAALREGFRRNAERERERGVTLSGPHRDDLVLSFGEDALDLRDFGSGGQQRAAAVALRMVEAQTIRDARDLEPIILLDDVFAEFDTDRSARILELMEETERGQVVMTVPKESDVHPRGAALRHWHITAGRIEA